jgi:anti-sigma regulatory factor (Ser/Thr protein kinase)
MRSEAHTPEMTIVHDALMYRDLRELVAGTRAFVAEGLDAGEPVMIAAPAGHVAVLRGALGESARDVRFADMSDVGRNPARIIPFVREWLDGHGGRAARFVGEPIWSGRDADEMVEGYRHEGLLNIAFADAPVSILCPYDTSALPADVIVCAGHTHTGTIAGGTWQACDDYRDPLTVYAARDLPLAEPPADVDSMTTGHDLAAARRFVRRHAVDAGLGGDRSGDLLVAVNEAVTNGLLHGRDPIVLRAWRTPATLVCEIGDLGQIVDPLAGRRRPDTHTPHGRGLWLINQLCDLVELRSDAAGTTLRMHMRLA